MGISVAKATEILDKWVQASLAVADGQEYQIGDRRLKRVDAQHINKQIDYWERKVAELERAAAYPRAGMFAVARFDHDC